MEINEEKEQEVKSGPNQFISNSKLFVVMRTLQTKAEKLLAKIAD